MKESITLVNHHEAEDILTGEPSMNTNIPGNRVVSEQ